MISCIDLISFILYCSFSILVHNQCSDLELVYPEYLSHNATWYIPPNQKVDANTMSSSSFRKDETEREFITILIYRLQKKKHLESDVDNTKDMSTNI
jgi:hypothetical protein